MSDRLTIQQLQEFLADPDDFEISGNRQLAVQLLATMQREAKLREALQYWLPVNMPLYGASRNDLVVAKHQDKWHEAKTLLSSEYSVEKAD